MIGLMAVATLCDVFASIESRSRPDLFYIKAKGVWNPVPAAQFAARVRGLASYLVSVGAAAGDRIAIFSENRIEWQISAFAIQLAGCVDVPIYATSSKHQIHHVLADSGAKAAFVSGTDMLAKLLAAAPRGFEGAIVFDAPAQGGVPDAHAASTGPAAPSASGASAVSSAAPLVVPLSVALAKGEDLHRKDPEALAARTRAVRPGDLSSLVYTSGTTGDPKGVMLTHGNFSSNIVACLSIVGFDERDIALSFLPLSHVFERMAEYLYLAAGGGIAYTESMDTIAANLLEVRPTVICAVPRVLEKLHAKILENVERQSALRRRLFAWAVATGKARLGHVLAGRPVPPLLAARVALAERFVFSRIKERLGGRVRLLVSGGAPLARELAEFFLGAGVVVLEGYGLTESSPVIALNAPGRLRPGTVGQVIPGVEVRIAADGEILARGPNIMKGYFGDEEATRAMIRDGWLATGDIGSLDADGFLAITDRKKDLIVTSGGKNVAPQPIESALKESRYIANAVLLGDRRKYIGALIVPDLAAIENQLSAGGGEKVPRAATSSDLLKRPEVLALIQEEVDRVNGRLASYEQIRRFVLLDRDLSAEAGELTPTLKVRRRTLLETRREAIAAIYQE
jgi:long-chain acyl-CoA synthetase